MCIRDRRDFEPKEKPDDRFYDVMRQLSAIGNNLHQITVCLLYTSRCV